MAKVLSFIGAKGGTLKTASAAAVAHVLAKAGLRVVMVDLDPQADLTSRSKFSRVADPLTAEPVVVRYDGEPELALWLLRGGRSMEAADFEAVRRHLARAAALDPDLVVIDTPPALGPATRAAAAAAAFVVIPSEPGKESLMRAHDVISIATDGGHRPIIRILLTKANVQTNLYRWMVDNVDALYPSLRSPVVVPHETAAAESAVFDRPVTVSAPRSKSAQAYCDIAADVIGRLGVERRTVVARSVA
jgi:chromosome partitioning protein